jgi:hypothetical protein
MGAQPNVGITGCQPVHVRFSSIATRRDEGSTCDQVLGAPHQGTDVRFGRNLAGGSSETSSGTAMLTIRVTSR